MKIVFPYVVPKNFVCFVVVYPRKVKENDIRDRFTPLRGNYESTRSIIQVLECMSCILTWFLFYIFLEIYHRDRFVVVLVEQDVCFVSCALVVRFGEREMIAYEVYLSSIQHKNMTPTRL